MFIGRYITLFSPDDRISKLVKNKKKKFKIDFSIWFSLVKF